MSVSAFTHATINSFFRLLFNITGAFSDADITGPISCGVSFERDGTVDEIATTTGTTLRGSWWSGAVDTDIGDRYEVRALSAGASGAWTVAAAADDTWIALSADRLWSVTRAGVGISTVTRTFEIRRIGTTAPLISRSFTVQAEVVI